MAAIGALLVQMVSVVVEHFAQVRQSVESEILAGSEDDELVDLGLELELEFRRGELDARSLGDEDEVAHAFDDLRVVIEALGVGLLREHELHLEGVGRLADEERLSLAPFCGAHEVADVGAALERVEGLDAALDGASAGNDFPEARRAQWSAPPPCVPRVGTMPYWTRASARAWEPVRCHRS